MHPHVVTDKNPNEHYGVRACSFAGQQKSNDCSGPWFSFPTQHIRVANPLAPHVCVCEHHLSEAHKAASLHDNAGVNLVEGGVLAPKPRSRRPRGKPLDDIAL